MKTLLHMNKEVYLGTTYKCSACKLMAYILKEVLKDRPDVELKTLDYTELPEWIKTNVRLSDFPCVVFVVDDVIKFTFTGTKPAREVRQIIKDINF